MIILLEHNVTQDKAQELITRLERMGFKALLYQNNNQFIIAIVDGVDQHTQPELFNTLPYVERIQHFKKPYKLVGNELHSHRRTINFSNTRIGDSTLTLMAGPCSIESEEQIHRIAQQVAKAGATFLRGGAFKPRTSPYDFQGLGIKGLEYMQQAAQENNLHCISEVMDVKQFELAIDKVDIVQVGARNMYNYSFLKVLGKIKKPILLKRGLSATYKEFLLAAEYILNEGNPNVILCERGIRTFENHTRNTLDLNAIPVLKELSHLPIIIDPSHGTGIRKMVTPMSNAAVAAGADGLIIETHYDPDNALSDSQQTISTKHFAEMIPKLKQIHQLLNQT